MISHLQPSGRVCDRLCVSFLQELQVEFEFFSPEEKDFLGLKSLLVPYLNGQEFDSSALIDAIIAEVCVCVCVCVCSCVCACMCLTHTSTNTHTHTHCVCTCTSSNEHSLGQSNLSVEHFSKLN